MEYHHDDMQPIHDASISKRHGQGIMYDYKQRTEQQTIYGVMDII